MILRPIRARGSVLLLPLVLLLAACSDGIGPEPPEQGIELPEDARMAVVRLGPSVTPQTRAHLRGLYSVFNDAPISGEMQVPVPDGPGGALVMAVNADEFAVLAAHDVGGVTVMDYRSTALAAVRMILVPGPTVLASPEEINALVLSHPSFGELVGVISDLAERGESFVNSEVAAKLVAAIVTDVLAVIPAPPLRTTAAPPGSSPLDGTSVLLSTAREFAAAPVSLSDGPGTSYLLTNTSFIFFSATLHDAEGDELASVVLPARNVTFAGAAIPPYKTDDPTVTTLAGKNGRATVTLGQNKASELAMLASSFSDITDILMTTVGLGGAEDVRLMYVEAFTKIIFPAWEAWLRGDEKDLAKAVTMFVVGFDTEMFKATLLSFYKGYKGLIGKDKATKAVLKNVLGFMKVAEVTVKVVERSFFYLDWQKYSNVVESMNVCQKDGVLVEKCYELELNPDSATIQVGRAVMLTARVRDPAGVVVPDRTFSWASGNSGIAEVADGDIAGTATVTGKKVGSTWIYAQSKAEGEILRDSTWVGVGGIKITPTSASVGVGRAATFSATVYSPDGEPVRSASVTWGLTNTSVARQEPNGSIVAVIGKAPGTTWLIATSGDARDSVSVTVLLGGMRDLGNFGGDHSEGRDINDAGWVVGESEDADDDDFAFLWTEAAGMRNLGESDVYAINNAGQVVGRDEGGVFLWTEAGGKRYPASLAVDLPPRPEDINEAGHVAGSYSIFGRAADLISGAFLWTEAGGFRDLGTLGGDESSATGLNDAGQVVGWSQNAAGVAHAFLWTEAGGMRDLGVLGGGSESVAAAINNAGQVVGWSQNAAGVVRAFLWTEAGGMRDLGILGGDYTRATDINDAGWVVGVIDGYDIYGNLEKLSRGFLWTPEDGTRDIGDLGGGWTEAHAINNAGWVTGWSYIAEGRSGRGGQRAFLWTP